MENKVEMEEEFYKTIRDNKHVYAFTTFGRAFPSNKDGLKAVARRILFNMIEENITKVTKKSAKVVGNVTGNYHPHGTSSVYVAIVNMAQYFSNNYPLIFGQGNFGSVNGDGAASERYTEIKLSQFAQDVIDQIDKFSVDFEANYDNSREICKYIPFKVPMLLLNGSYGIGEAYVSSTPPHNLSDVVDVCKKFIFNKNISNEELVDGLYPDFPNYGIVTNKSEVERYYKYGEKCTIKMKSTMDIDRENNKIYVRDLPYGVSKNTIVDTIRKKNEEKHLIMSKIYDMVDIKTHRDSKNDIHYEYEIIFDKNSNILEIANELMNTCLTSSVTLNFMLYCDNYVKPATILTIVSDWYAVRSNTIRRKINHKLINCQNRVQLLEGVLIIYDHIDEVINYIKTSESKDDVIDYLVKTYPPMSMIQAKYIVEMQLFKLSRVSKDTLLSQIAELYDQIKVHEHDLFRIDDIILDELDWLKNKYQRPRRTIITDEKQDNKDINSIIMSSGTVMHSLNQFAVFDTNNLVNSNKTMLNGLKSVKVDGKNVKDILNVTEITDEISGLLVMFNNGTARKIEASELKYLNNWMYVNNDTSFISQIVPIYTNGEKIIELTDDAKIKILDPNIFTKNISNHGNIVACSNIHPDDNCVLICDSEDNYIVYTLEEIPEVTSKAAAGVKTCFDELETLNKTMIKTFDDGKEYEFIFTIVDKEGNSYILSKGVQELGIFGRPGRMKKLLKIDTDDFKLVDVNIVETCKKNTKCIMIGNGTTGTLKINNFKNLDEPKKININTKCIVQFSDE